MKINDYIRHAPYFKNDIAYDHEFWYTCAKDDIFRFLSFV